MVMCPQILMFYVYSNWGKTQITKTSCYHTTSLWMVAATTVTCSVTALQDENLQTYMMWHEHKSHMYINFVHRVFQIQPNSNKTAAVTMCSVTGQCKHSASREKSVIGRDKEFSNSTSIHINVSLQQLEDTKSSIRIILGKSVIKRGLGWLQTQGTWASR